ncbi:MAG: FHA domain-containing protein [Anaerolineae bacterium]|jgi:ABC-type multidrug transport system ATPase subunit|nr:FHA domain-containing protein [Anaerolineae bacterium]
MENLQNELSNFVLQFIDAAGALIKIRLPIGDFQIGRSPESDLVLPLMGISRRHARLTVSEDQTITLMDLGSANGTRLGENPLRPRETFEITLRQSFTIGPITFQLTQFVPEHASEEKMPENMEEPMVDVEEKVKSAHFILRYRHIKQQDWREYTLTEDQCIIGRTENTHIRLDSEIVSRQHARISMDENKCWLTDLNSANGVLIGKECLAPGIPQEIFIGTQFTIGEFLFEYTQSQEALALDPEVLDALIQSNAANGESGETLLGVELGVDMDSIGLDSAPAPVNLAGHERVTIGRAEDNMITLNHPLVSRYHAVIERMGTRTRITDLHSANGIYVNNQAIKTNSWLKPDDVIKIGPYAINFTGNQLKTSSEQSYNIAVIGLQKWVSNDVNLLKDISLNIAQNEFIALVGMSGAGKSTLMDAINGFRPSTHGQVLVNGVDLYQNYNQFRNEIGNVPQRDIVHMELTAQQALNYAAELRMPSDATEKDRQEAVAETLENLGLTYRKDLQISRLSGGQIKRVSIGVELLTKPKLFFLDEPTSGLDPGTEYEMMKLLRRLADQGRTIMLITHATKNVMFCDKVIILANKGNLAFYGPPEEALIYFDQFRNHREQLEKEMEFDDIYRILEDPERGTPENWRERYLNSEYAHYAMPKQTKETAVPDTAKPMEDIRAKAGHRISGFRQFGILSRRYIRCMLQDRVSLILTLALAPILGLMNFIWGNTLFDPVIGNAAKTMGVWFAVSIMGNLVGYIGSIQELVKERPIYKRERAVGLKISSYILSKTWVGGALSFYQAFFILLFAVLLSKPFVSAPSGYIIMYFTLVLVIFSSFVLGLVISALSANANTAQLIMIAAFVPQMLLAGVLQPLHMIVGGELISPIVVTRWGFENFVNATGIGEPLVNDPCWSELDREVRNALSNEEKDAMCTCMGSQLFTNCATIPGILSEDFYNAEAQTVLAALPPQQPDAPEQLPTPTRRSTPTTLPSPTFFPSPTYLPTPTAWATLTPPAPCTQPGQTGCLTMQNQQQVAADQMAEYQETRSAQFDDYRGDTEDQFEAYQDDVGDQMEEYKEEIQDQIDTFAEEEHENIDTYSDENLEIFEAYEDTMVEYSDNLSYHERSRQEAISSAEAILSILWDDYGTAFRGSYSLRMLYIGIITVVQFIILLFLMKRQDTV